MEWEKQPEAGTGAGNASAQLAQAPGKDPIGEEQIKQLLQIWQGYKAARAETERRIIATENWWKLRNDMEEAKQSAVAGTNGFKSKSGWLVNVIISKHADAMEAFPEPNVLPREPSDRDEAKILSDIIPCILEQNNFERTYSDAAWQKLKAGTGAYKIVWDQSKLNGLGDITISKVNLLNLYFQPGVDDIQKSRYVFHLELMDDDLILEQYKDAADALGGKSVMINTFQYDDTVSTDGKHLVVDCYYHKVINGKNTVQYVKFVENTLLYASENDPEKAERGWYDHGLYPYVLDPLYPIEGSPYGYGYVDLCRNPQHMIDLMNTAFLENAMAGAIPRYMKTGGGIQERDFTDLTKHIIPVEGSMSDQNIRLVDYKPLDGNYLSLVDRTINELRETSGNTETAAGSSSHGVTAASAIAALQEASGKGSRDSNLAAYRAYREIVGLCIELIRQFYDMPRQFRIIGQYGMEQFVTYQNAKIQPMAQIGPDGLPAGYRVPEFDIKVSAQRRTAYSKIAQNEMAIQFFQLGFFHPQMADQAIMCMDMMDFEGKDELMQKIIQNGTMYQKMLLYMQMALSLAQKYEPGMVPGLSQDVMQVAGAGNMEPSATANIASLGYNPDASKEPAHVGRARDRAHNAGQPEEGTAQ